MRPASSGCPAGQARRACPGKSSVPAAGSVGCASVPRGVTLAGSRGVMIRRRAFPVVLVLLLGLAASGEHALAAPSARPDKVSRFKSVLARVTSRFSRPKSKAKSSSQLGLRESLRRAREELQLYRGRKLEHWSDRLAYGKSDFDAQRS